MSESLFLRMKVAEALKDLLSRFLALRELPKADQEDVFDALLLTVSSNVVSLVRAHREPGEPFKALDNAFAEVTSRAEKTCRDWLRSIPDSHKAAFAHVLKCMLTAGFVPLREEDVLAIVEAARA